jgi:hypothetical protein
MATTDARPFRVYRQDQNTPPSSPGSRRRGIRQRVAAARPGRGLISMLHQPVQSRTRLTAPDRRDLGVHQPRTVLTRKER